MDTNGDTQDDGREAGTAGGHGSRAMTGSCKGGARRDGAAAVTTGSRMADITPTGAALQPDTVAPAAAASGASPEDTEADLPPSAGVGGVPGRRSGPRARLIVHGSAVAIALAPGRGDTAAGVLITGASGRGKSALALHLMALGATLVADDRTIVAQRTDGLILKAPATIRGLIEARGLGLLQADTVAEAPLSVIIDLDRAETDRLPPPRHRSILGQDVPCLHRIDNSYFPAAILQYVRGGRTEAR